MSQSSMLVAPTGCSTRSGLPQWAADAKGLAGHLDGMSIQPVAPPVAGGNVTAQGGRRSCRCGCRYRWCWHQQTCRINDQEWSTSNLDGHVPTCWYISKSENLSAGHVDIAPSARKCAGVLACLIWATGVHLCAILAILRKIRAGSRANRYIHRGGPVVHGHHAVQ